jgi:vancomycin resistance protein YoaR
MAARKTSSARSSRSRSNARSTGKPWRIDYPTLKFALGFGLGVFGVLVLATVISYGLSHAYDGKIMPGVHVGKVDLSGKTRAQAIATLNSAYSYLGKGQVVVTTPGGSGTISYKDAGRGPNSAAMADAAMSVGRGTNPVTGMALTLKTFTLGVDIPVIVKLDPTAFEKRLQDLTGSSLEPATDYSVAIQGAGYTVVDGANGKGIDQTAIAKQAIDKLANPATPSQLKVGGSFVAVLPSVTADDAQAAIASAKNMVQDVTLTYNGKTWTIPADTVRSWIMFGLRTDGKYGPVVQPAMVTTYVNSLAKQVNVDAVEPTVNYDKSGRPTGINGGTAGQSLNVGGSTQAIAAYLDGLGSSGQSTGPVSLAVDSVDPKITGESVKGFVVIGQVTTIYFPGESNGNGANISIPATRLDKQVIEPGEEFSFLRAMGPIDAAHGWKPGGVINKGHSEHTGAIGGGICSASTTFFQAAAVAGLQVDERHAHYYWISRYILNKTVGLDATVFSNGVTTYDLKITNDTSYPIVIRSWISGSRATKAIHVQLWSMPTGRKTTFSGGMVPGSLVKATDLPPIYNALIPVGQKSPYHAEYATNGFDASVTRSVVDANNAMIHQDTWGSHYSKVDGQVLITGPKPKPTPTPRPPTPAPSSAGPLLLALALFGRRRRADSTGH